MHASDKLRIKMTTAAVAKRLLVPHDPRRPTMIYDLGEDLMAIDFDRQVAEIKARAAALNIFTKLGTPKTQRV